MDMKIFILANGDGKRWGNYLGLPKHLITVNGESLIDRMVRLCKKEGADDITIVGTYQIEGCSNYINQSIHKYDVFIELAEFANKPFIILNGDCYYTDAIIHDCITRPIAKWGHWENPDHNDFTGKDYGEGYIHKITDLEWWLGHLKRFKEEIDRGWIDMSLGNDWIINEYLYNRDSLYTGQHKPCAPYDILWEDETDDFDFPEDYDRFLRYTGYKR